MEAERALVNCRCLLGRARTLGCNLLANVRRLRQSQGRLEQIGPGGRTSGKRSGGLCVEDPKCLCAIGADRRGWADHASSSREWRIRTRCVVSPDCLNLVTFVFSPPRSRGLHPAPVALRHTSPSRPAAPFVPDSAGAGKAGARGARRRRLRWLSRAPLRGTGEAPMRGLLSSGDPGRDS